MSYTSADICLKRGKEQSLKRLHPWVFSGAVSGIKDSAGRRLGEEDLHNGQLVMVYSFDNELLGCGHFQKGSIMVRMLLFASEGKIPAEYYTAAEGLKPKFWQDMLQSAYNHRRTLGLTENPHTNCYRLIHGEGDFLPGVIVDIYGKTAVIQAHSAGMANSVHQLAEALKKVYPSIEAIYSKSTAYDSFKGADDYLYKAAKEEVVEERFSGNVVLENGCKFWIDWERGQKTGFFLDQRDSRALVMRYASDKKVLNLFSYTGGFSVYAMRGGALFVDSVDSSEYAIEAADANLILNGFESRRFSGKDMVKTGRAAASIGEGQAMEACGAESRECACICTDAIDYLREAPANKYDLIIVDPPAFAKHLSAKRNALRAYQKLNALAIGKVKKGGIIFTFSCSQVVDKQDFALAVFSAAAQTGRKVRIIHRLTQPADHPVSIYHPEGEYLKGLVLLVD